MLVNESCTPTATKLSAQEVDSLLKELPNWAVVDGLLSRKFAFKNFHETMAFVNAAAWVAHQQDHHPDMFVGYSKVTLNFATHSVGGLTRNDFICAARIDLLNA